MIFCPFQCFFELFLLTHREQVRQGAVLPSGTPVYRPESKKIDLQQLLLQVKQRWTKSDPSTTHAVSLRSTERPGSLRFDLGHHGGLGHRLLSRQQAMTRDRYDMQTQTPSR